VIHVLLTYSFIRIIQASFGDEKKLSLFLDVTSLIRIHEADADSMQELLKKNEKKTVRFFCFTFRYVDDVLTLTNSKFGNYVDRMYPIDTTYTDRVASYLNYT